MTGEPERLTSAEAWQFLAANPTAQLVDVRSAPEWSFVGQPDLAALGRQLVRISWQTYPGMKPNPDFVADLRAQGFAPDQPLLFLCRSGARSLNAARAAMAEGFTRCINVTDGFEGDKDANRQRGRLGGWRHAGLPWIQD